MTAHSSDEIVLPTRGAESDPCSHLLLYSLHHLAVQMPLPKHDRKGAEQAHDEHAAFEDPKVLPFLFVVTPAVHVPRILAGDKLFVLRLDAYRKVLARPLKFGAGYALLLDDIVLPLPAAFRGI